MPEEDDFTLPVDPAETASEVEGEDQELDQEDDEGVSDPSGEPDPEESGPGAEAFQQPRQGRDRAGERIRALSAERKAERERADRLQQELVQALRERHAPQPPQVDPRAEQERISLMSDREYFEYVRAKDRAETALQFQKLSMENEVRADHSKFAAIVSGRPELKRFENEVEKRFQDYMRQGNPQTRESILKIVVGETVLAKGGKALAAARETGRANIARETTRPGSARSNVSESAGRYSKDSAEAALERIGKVLAAGGQL